MSYLHTIVVKIHGFAYTFAAFGAKCAHFLVNFIDRTLLKNVHPSPVTHLEYTYAYY